MYCVAPPCSVGAPPDGPRQAPEEGTHAAAAGGSGAPAVGPTHNEKGTEAKAEGEPRHAGEREGMGCPRERGRGLALGPLVPCQATKGRGRGRGTVGG